MGTYPDLGISEIIFGLNMPDDHKNMLRGILKNKGIAFFQVAEGAGEFMLEIQLLDK